ncbi:beta-1,3-galactosyltransferase 1-like [Argonauta hians]
MKCIPKYHPTFWILLYPLLSQNFSNRPNIVLSFTGDDPDTFSLDTFVTAHPRDPNSAVPKKFYEAPRNCNPHPYMYLINPSRICAQKDEVFLLILIRTIFSQFERRMAIRETWGDKRNLRNVSVVIAFLFGRDKDLHLQPSIQRESEIYKDIIQEDFIESYENLTLKTVMAWKWSKQYCPHATYVMVMNDEIFVDMFKLIPYLRQITLKPHYDDHFAFCYFYPCCTAVYHKGKYEAQNYSSTAYPEYCSGVAYAASMKVINQLYLMSIDTPMFMPDDAWVGVLAEKLQLKFIDTSNVFEGISVKSSILKKFMNPDYLGSGSIIAVLDYVFPKQEAVMIRHLWHIVRDHHRKSFLRNQINAKKVNANADYKMFEGNSVFYLVAYTMFIDVFIVGIILFLLFYRRKIRMRCKASYQCLNY